jgi:hypothetical protein
MLGNSIASIAILNMDFPQRPPCRGFHSTPPDRRKRDDRPPELGQSSAAAFDAKQTWVRRQEVCSRRCAVRIHDFISYMKRKNPTRLTLRAPSGSTKLRIWVLRSTFGRPAGRLYRGPAAADRLLLPAALLLLSRRSLATLLLTLLLIAALIVLSIFVWISHFNYLIVSTNSLITSLTIGKHDHNDP